MMLRRVLLAAPALVVAGRTSAQKQLVIPLKWYRVQVEDSAFTVEMPGVPDHRVINDVSARGTAFPLHSYSLEAGGYSYVAQTALYPTDVDTTQPRRLIQSALDARAASLDGGKWSKVEWREIQAGAVAESVGALRGGKAIRQLVLLKERRFVSLAFLGAAGTANVMEADRFFKSFKIA